jgi:hypothetical protein
VLKHRESPVHRCGFFDAEDRTKVLLKLPYVNISYSILNEFTSQNE